LDGIDRRHSIGAFSEKAIAQSRGLRIYQLINGRHNGASRAAHEKARRPLLRTYAGFVPSLAKFRRQTGVIGCNPVERSCAYRTFRGQFVLNCHLAIATSHLAEIDEE
jgi:hypothetical protein